MHEEKKKYPPKELGEKRERESAPKTIRMVPTDPTTSSISIDGKTYAKRDGAFEIPIELYPVVRRLGYTEERKK